MVATGSAHHPYCPGSPQSSMLSCVLCGGIGSRNRNIMEALVWMWWRRRLLLVLVLVLLLGGGGANGGGGDAEALLQLKSSLDGSGRLPWRAETAAGMCSWWVGVRQCDGQGRVRKLVLEGLNLTGSLASAVPLPGELRVLSLKSNALTGPIPAAFPPNLKLLYLADNRLEGRIPASLALLHRATVIVLSGNRLSGQIPAALAALPPRLTSLLLDRNLLTGPIPEFRQATLRLLNVSSNRLEGRIPESLAARFDRSSFLPNSPALCGPPLPTSCPPSSAPATAAPFAPLPAPGSTRRRRVTVTAAATVAGAVLLAILVAAAVLILKSRRGRSKTRDAVGCVDPKDLLEEEPSEEPPPATGGAGGPPIRDFSWERDGIGKLVFCGGAATAYSLEELLRASAETLGRGEVGSTYKAVMETGFIVTVKRMRDPSSSPGDFGRRADELGSLRHPNVVPLRAYFQAKEERLLVYDYYPNGSLFALVHGSRPSSKGKPLHWTSCMKIAEDVAAGLVHLHQSPPGVIVHGNLKPSNVLLGPDFESCLTDYGLVPSMLPTGHVSDASSVSLLYRAPEVRAAGAFTPASDVYSFGVLLLELLTGRTPFQDLLVDDDIPGWVRAVRDEERDTDSAGDSTSGAAAAGGAEEKLTALVAIAAACVVADPASRPTTPEVLRMVREARAEAMSSSNSSDRSPARWSDAILGHHQADS